MSRDIDVGLLYAVLADLLWRCSRTQVRLMPTAYSLPGISTYSCPYKEPKTFSQIIKHTKHTSDIHCVHYKLINALCSFKFIMREMAYMYSVYFTYFYNMIWAAAAAEGWRLRIILDQELLLFFRCWGVIIRTGSLTI